MSLQKLTSLSIGALAGATLLALSFTPASAFTLAGPSMERPVAAAQVQQVWWRHGWGWHGGGRHCWINRWGNRVCRW